MKYMPAKSTLGPVCDPKVTEDPDFIHLLRKSLTSISLSVFLFILSVRREGRLFQCDRSSCEQHVLGMKLSSSTPFTSVKDNKAIRDEKAVKSPCSPHTDSHVFPATDTTNESLFRLVTS